MEYNFSKHTKLRKRYETRISINKSMNIGLPTGFWEENEIDSFDFAVLFYDKLQNLVGVKFTRYKEVGAISIAKHNKGYGGHIPAKSFFKLNRIDTVKYAGRYQYRKLSMRSVGIPEEGSLFTVDLNSSQQTEDEGVLDSRSADVL